MPRTTRFITACLIVLTSLAILPQAQHGTVQAASETVTDCSTQTAFTTALAAVQSSGGGTVVIACTDPIDISVQQTITSDVTIIGNGAILDGGGDTRFFVVNDNARLTLIGLTLRNGEPRDDLFSRRGGAIENLGTLELIACTFEDNSTSAGGGAISTTAGSVSITASSFSENGKVGSAGGAIFILDGTVEITASTFSENGTESSAGGAIFIFGGTVEITASTFSENEAGGAGGAIDIRSGSVAIVASTFHDNFSRLYPYDSIFNDADGSVSIGASILTNSYGNVCYGKGNWNSLGYNLIDDQFCGLGGEGDQEEATVTINLGDLQDNGGPTYTMEPLDGSDAIGAIPAADCLTYTTSPDQRGVPRPQGDCEVGAVELGDVPVQIITTFDNRPIYRGTTAIVGVVASGPASATLTYEFDCDDNGDYEVSQAEPMWSCTFPGVGTYPVSVRVSDGTTAVIAGMTVEVLEATPEITSLELVPSPSDEGIDEVMLAAAFTNPNPGASHNCTIDWGDGTTEDGDVAEAGGSRTCEGAHTFADNDEYTVAVEICDTDNRCDDMSELHTVNNLPPEIHGIVVSTVEPGEPLTVSVTASDPAGDNDPLTYEFDCDNDGSYEVTPQTGNSRVCRTASDNLSPVFGVRVSDDDGGQTEQTVTAALSKNYCVDRYTGALSPGNDGCGTGQAVVVVRAGDPTTFCASPWTRELRYWWAGCQPGWQAYVVPGPEPIPACVSMFTGAMRLAPATGACGLYETLHLIPASGGLAPPNSTR